jgi:peptidyl-dipeptidase A
MFLLKVTTINRIFFLIPLSFFLVLNCNTEKSKMENEFKSFLKDFETKVIPLSRESNLVYFNATTTGKDELYQKLENLNIELSGIYANKEDFQKLKKIQESGTVTDPILKRQLDILYHQYLAKQIDKDKLEKMIQLETALEKKFSTYRAEFNNKKYTDNQIDQILKTSTDSRLLEKAWKASKQVGKVVESDVLQLIAMRNETAKELGFSNYHEMQLRLNEQDPKQIEQLFDELDELTRDTFVKLKSDIDNFLAKRYDIKKVDLMPWHYQNKFFQEAVKIYTVDLDQFYKNQDLVQLTREFYKGINLPVDDMIKNSDLFEREGKYQHAYCTDIDREGDVRVVCNIQPTHNWMSTMLHEYGHAVYSKYHDRELPWLLRDAAHTLTTEAIAMLFEKFAANPEWIKIMAKVSPTEVDKVAEDCFKSTRLETLVFSRWSQVMYRFEKNMYENPEQDLNRLWWDLVEKYQMIKRPPKRDEPDWSSKIHLALYPVYYHNYLMGVLLASQFYYYIVKNVLQENDLSKQTFIGRGEVGDYLVNKVFKPGTRYNWNEMIENATGEKLTARYYAMQYVE